MPPDSSSLEINMWVKKKSSEITQDKERKAKSIKAPFFGSLFWVFVFALMIKFGFNPRRMDSIEPISWESFFIYGLPICITIGLISFFYNYRKQIRTKVPYGDVPTMICLNCNNSKRLDDNKKCDCGGLYVDIDELKWIEK